MAGRAVQRMRNLLVWLHVVTSVGWMAQALALFALLVHGANADDPAVRHSAYTMAQVLDHHVLLYLANTSAFTGIMLAATTSWGFFRHWWVLAKFAITLSQLYLGIFVLSPILNGSVDAAARGGIGPTGRYGVGPLLMLSAIAFQAWLSVAKPWGRTRWAASARPRRLPTASAGMLGYCVAAPVVDWALATFVFGSPAPMLMMTTVIWYPIARAVRLRRLRRAEATSTRATPEMPDPAVPVAG